MPLSRFALLLLLILVLAEAGLTLWRNAPIAPSTAPVFSYPVAAANFNQPGELAGVIELFHADRGAECKLTAQQGGRLTVFYFEWDRIEAGPVMSMVGHAPDECNVAAGYKLEEVAASRSYKVPSQPPLIFDCTRFTSPAGKQVFGFKLAWIQGLGSRPLREAGNRVLRFRNSFTRHIGAARVLEAGVFDARDADHAWQIFCGEVLDKLEWKGKS